MGLIIIIVIVVLIVIVVIIIGLGASGLESVEVIIINFDLAGVEEFDFFRIQMPYHS